MPKVIVDSVLQAFYAVYNELQCGFLEAVYCTALANELSDRRVKFVRDQRVNVVCKGRVVGYYKPDFVVEEQLVVEVKASRAIGDADARQLVNSLRTTDLELGYLLHFGPEARFLRVISSRSRR